MVTVLPVSQSCKSVSSRSPRAHLTTVSIKDGSAPLGQHKYQVLSTSSPSGYSISLVRSVSPSTQCDLWCSLPYWRNTSKSAQASARAFGAPRYVMSCFGARPSTQVIHIQCSHAQALRCTLYRCTMMIDECSPSHTVLKFLWLVPLPGLLLLFLQFLRLSLVFSCAFLVS